MNFDQWMQKVDTILIEQIGLSSMDLRDRMWHDAFDGEASPLEAIIDLCGDPRDLGTFMENELFG